MSLPLPPGPQPPCSPSPTLPPSSSPTSPFPELGAGGWAPGYGLGAWTPLTSTQRALGTQTSSPPQVWVSANSKDSAWPGGCQGPLTPGFSYPSEWFGGSDSLSNLNVRHLEGRDPIISCFLGQRLGLMQDSVPGFRGCPLTPGQHPQGCRLEQSFSPSLHTGTWAQRS